jgi:hypothetical protein
MYLLSALASGPKLFVDNGREECPCPLPCGSLGGELVHLLMSVSSCSVGARGNPVDREVEGRKMRACQKQIREPRQPRRGPRARL